MHNGPALPVIRRDKQAVATCPPRCTEFDSVRTLAFFDRIREGWRHGFGVATHAPIGALGLAVGLEALPFVVVVLGIQVQLQSGHDAVGNLVL